jgi:DNA invertase Pin-like site-specific DNA recombinase
MSQEDECVKYCKNNNMRIHQIQKEHNSGYGKQKILEKLIMTNKKINLIIYDVSRFSRNKLFGYNLLKRCVKNNINVHFAKENIIFDSKNDMLPNKITIGLDESETEWHSIRNRTLQSILYRRKNGLCLGNPPFGFDSVDKKLVKNGEFNVIKLIVALHNGVKPSSEIKEILKTLSPEYTTLEFYDENNNVIPKLHSSFTLDFKTIAGILNDYKICGKHWIQSRVRDLYLKYRNDKELKDDTEEAIVMNMQQELLDVQMNED